MVLETRPTYTWELELYFSELVQTPLYKGAK
jgi:hypothetical protein